MTRIGITGHSNLTDATADLVYEAIREALAPHTGPDLIGISCLAVGADQIFAQVVLDVGGRLEVVLPAPDYRDRKVTPDNLKTFDTLLTKAETVHYTDHPTSGRPAYMAASRILTALSDHLFAVWDGGPSGGHGGTADVVTHARTEDKPVTILWPTGSTRS
ncbi:hypothetical protein LO762_12500 [Actinocorallia sp. API 0066]|uniref:hypothetical protein n=1 Tax=Actinocorallia sp. API 0066 TaxID=2896846 RepID=UPI001E3F8895|nr:hypothetical protein [Actinocorallia sp. API 0066]MCD0450006.1 hypothetical protein [Actinocorallia sp. API 0066]